jgi:hypothetical protein
MGSSVVTNSSMRLELRVYYGLFMPICLVKAELKARGSTSLVVGLPSRGCLCALDLHRIRSNIATFGDDLKAVKLLVFPSLLFRTEEVA